MSFYQKLTKVGAKYIGKSKLLKYAFNLSPMYRRSTGKVIFVSDNLKEIHIKIPISYKNRNYVNSIFGGSMFSAVDPIPMVQLIQLIGDEYVVWDKSASVRFRRPAKEDLFASFTYTDDELEQIKERVTTEDEIEIIKTTELTNKDKTIVYCVVEKTIYISTKTYFNEKRKRRNKK